MWGRRRSVGRSIPEVPNQTKKRISPPLHSLPAATGRCIYVTLSNTHHISLPNNILQTPNLSENMKSEPEDSSQKPVQPHNLKNCEILTPSPGETIPAAISSNAAHSSLTVHADVKASFSPRPKTAMSPALSNSSSTATLVEECSTPIIAVRGESVIPTSNTGIPKDPTEVKPCKPTREDVEEPQDDTDKVIGWPERAPFSHGDKNSRAKLLKKYTFWSDLTWKEKLNYRKEFLKQYLTEIKLCLGYARRLFIMIYRISPWRTIAILAINFVNAFLPAIKLRTSGNFITMVMSHFMFLNSSCKVGWRKET
jgi:hypothetical protein